MVWLCLPERGVCAMVLGAFTVTFSDLALQIIAGAIAAGLVGRAFRGGGFGLLGDLLLGFEVPRAPLARCEPAASPLLQQTIQARSGSTRVRHQPAWCGAR